MGEFAAVLQRRIDDECASLNAARAAGDEELSDALVAEIDNLRRIADQHGVAHSFC
jgi:hypothetical protein